MQLGGTIRTADSTGCRPSQSFQIAKPSAASAVATATVESTTMRATATLEASGWTASFEAAACEPMSFSVTPFKSASVPAVITAAIVAMAIISAAPVGMSPAVIPRAGADEDSIRKPARTVISVGRTGIRIVGVIPVGANRGARHIAGAEADAHAYSDLRL